MKIFVRKTLAASFFMLGLVPSGIVTALTAATFALIVVWARYVRPSDADSYEFLLASTIVFFLAAIALLCCVSGLAAAIGATIATSAVRRDPSRREFIHAAAPRAGVGAFVGASVVAALGFLGVLVSGLLGISRGFTLNMLVAIALLLPAVVLGYTLLFRALTRRFFVENPSPVASIASSV